MLLAAGRCAGSAQMYVSSLMAIKHCHIRVKGEEWLEDKVGVDNVKDD